MFRGRVRSVHFVGIGGVGMSGIAQVLLEHGFAVSGSDQRPGEATEDLQRRGATVFIGHDASHVRGADVVVYSSAVRPDNPEVTEAQRLQVPVIRRAEMLGELMRIKEGVAIAGSHGKTTTTSLLATVLRAANLKPTVVIGGRLNALGSGAESGEGDLLVAEADESDGSFLHLSPTISVITNLDPEHLDHFGSLDRVKDAFVTFANRVPFYGLVVACLDHPNVQSILPLIEKRVATYGFGAQADYRAFRPEQEGLQSRFEVHRRGEDLGAFEVRMPGVHNVLNALATIAVADELRVDHDVVREALRTFAGVQRRFSVLGQGRGVTVVDDYGHHPAEVRVTLQAARRAYGGRIVVVFQPHRYSRTRDLFGELTVAFNEADRLLLLDVYAAGEEPVPGADSVTLCQAIGEHGHRAVSYHPSMDDALGALVDELQPGDVVITMGAGDVTGFAPRLLSVL